MGMCVKLKWNRKRLGLSQAEFAKRVGLSAWTISKLETDETAWATIKADTQDKISSLFENMASWQPERADKILREINEQNCVESEVEIVEPKPVVRIDFDLESIVNKKDMKILGMIEFAYEELRDSKNHEEFEANIDMLKRILKRY